MTAERFGPYRVGTRLGHGGMGEVHEAWDTRRERTVALKRLLSAGQDDPDVRARFRRESRVAARLESPHVVPIHDFGVIDDQLFIDMRLIRGTDLGRVIDRRALAPARVVAIVEQVADALDSAHRAGIVHRDVKPSNVLRADTSSGRDYVYLADFGIAHIRSTSEESRYTETGQRIGTYAYMAPEQLRGERIDHRVDVYALGAVLFEALTGRLPFLGDTVSLIAAHLTASPPRPSAFAEIPRGLDDVVLTALAKDPSERFATAGELAAAVRAAAEAGPPLRQGAVHTESATRPPSSPPSSPPPAPPAAPAPPRVSGPARVPPGPVRPPRVIGPTLVRPAPSGRPVLWTTIALGVGVSLLVTLWLLGRTATSSPSADDVPTVSSAQLAPEVASKTGAQDVTCPGGLTGSIGATTTCSGRVNGASAQFGVTVTTVNGTQIGFQIARLG